MFQEFPSCPKKYADEKSELKNINSKLLSIEKSIEGIEKYFEKQKNKDKNIKENSIKLLDFFREFINMKRDEIPASGVLYFDAVVNFMESIICGKEYIAPDLNNLMPESPPQNYEWEAARPFELSQVENLETIPENPTDPPEPQQVDDDYF